MKKVTICLAVIAFVFLAVSAIAADTAKALSSEPAAGEQIDWQVISSGGIIKGSSDNHILSGTAGQTAVGGGTSDNYDVTHGFWQNYVVSCCETGGDANHDGSFNLGDAVYMVNLVFRSQSCQTDPPIGCPPPCIEEGDANLDGGVNIADVVYMINAIFRSDTYPLPLCSWEK
jgi:hypothetical protein